MKRVALALAASLLAGAAQAATFERVDLPDAPGGGIKIAGIIALGDEAAFHALAATMQTALVLTTGPGGSVAAAVAIGTELHNRGWSTLVPPQTNCASACSMIWLAGVHRMLGDGGQIGFHAMSMLSNGAYVETHEVDHNLRQWLTQLGYSDDTTATIVNTPPRLVRWLDRQELQANGIASDPYP